jgi:hypothetical protein
VGGVPGLVERAVHLTARGTRPLRKLLRAKPLWGAAIVALVLIAGSVTVTYTTAPPGNDEPTSPLPGGLPQVICDPDCNQEIRPGPAQVNEVDLQVNPVDPNNVVAAANDYAQPSGAHWVGYYWSRDGGRTWGQNLLPGYPGSRALTTLSGMGASGDPALAFDTRGNVYLAGIAFTVVPVPGPNPGRDSVIFVAKSADGGETYSQVVVVARAITKFSFHDKEWVTVDPTNDYVYVVWVRFNAALVGEMVFSRSTNGGLTWSAPRIISDATTGEFQVQGAYPMVTADGILHITWVDFQTNQVRYVRSTDHGATFSDPVDIATANEPPSPLPNANYRTALLPQGAVDTGYSQYQGSLYVAWNDYRNDDTDIYLTISRDGGDTWSQERRVNTNLLGDGTDQFMPDIAVTPQGYVVMIWYDRRDDPNNTLVRPYFAISTDGGENWTDFGVGPPFNGDHGGTSFLSGESHLIGDYIGIGTSDTYCALAWADTRHGTASQPNSDIFGARVQIEQGPVS